MLLYKSFRKWASSEGQNTSVVEGTFSVTFPTDVKNKYFPCSAHNKKDWQPQVPYKVDAQSPERDDQRHYRASVGVSTYRGSNIVTVQ